MSQVENTKIREIQKRIVKENLTLFKIFPNLVKGFYYNANPVDGWSCTEKDVAEWNIFLRTLLISIKSKKFDNFIAFMRENKELCFKIAKKVKEMGGFKEKNSYIIISKNKEILNNMMVWAFLSIIKPECEDPLWNYTLVGFETFEFMEIVELLEKSRYKKSYDDEDKLDSPEMYNRDAYFDVIFHSAGYLYEENEAIKVYKNLNNRMISIMKRGRNGTIILSNTPIPIFEQQIKNGIDSFHILDLRDIENSTEEAVEME